MEDPHLWSVKGGGADPTPCRPKATPPPCPVYPVLGCCWHLLPEGAQERWGGLGIKGEGAGGGHHDLSRHCCFLLSWCYQGDIVNFDLKSSWLGATLVIHIFFNFRIGGGELDGHGSDTHQTHPTLRDHGHHFSDPTFLAKLPHVTSNGTTVFGSTWIHIRTFSFPFPVSKFTFYESFFPFLLHCCLKRSLFMLFGWSSLFWVFYVKISINY